MDCPDRLCSPSVLSAAVRIEVYASFELQPMLGPGEQLREFTITMEQLLDRSARGARECQQVFPMDFGRLHHDSVRFSPEGWGRCIPMFIHFSDCCTAKLRGLRPINTSIPQPPFGKWVICADGVIVNPHLTTDSQGELENATNKGHNALSRYRKHSNKRDLEDSVTEFERALRVCPPNDPCRAAAQSNLATAKFILCQVEDGDLVIPLGLYHDALAARPIGHPDRPCTLIRLAAVYLALFQKLRGEDAATQAEVLLHEAMELSSADNFANRVVLFMRKLHGGRRVGPAEQNGQSLAEEGSVSRLMDEDPHDLSVYLLRRFERFGDLADLQQAVSILRKLVRSTSPWDDRYCAGLGNLAVALFCVITLARMVIKGVIVIRVGTGMRW